MQDAIEAGENPVETELEKNQTGSKDLSHINSQKRTILLKAVKPRLRGRSTQSRNISEGSLARSSMDKSDLTDKFNQKESIGRQSRKHSEAEGATI